MTDRELKPPALVLGGRSGSFGLAGSGPVARARSAPGRPWEVGLRACARIFFGLQSKNCHIVLEKRALRYGAHGLGGSAQGRRYIKIRPVA